MYSVLVLDDEKRICDTIRSVLESGIPEISRISVFYDGQEAYDYLLIHRVDILLLDIEVPGKTGLEIAQMVRKQKADSYIFIITAYHDFEYAHQAISFSVNEYLTKPFSSKQLIVSVQKAISYFKEKTSSEEEQRLAYRNLLLSLCQARTVPEGYGDIRFCRKSVPLKQLACTEITLTDIGFDSVPVQLLPIIWEKLTQSAESDSDEQTSLLIEHTPERIKVLVLSRSTPDLGFLPALFAVVTAEAGNAPVCIHRTYTSFTSYLEQLSFEREMDFFFDLLSDGSTSQAKKYLNKRILSFSPDQLQAFSIFLMNDYHVDVSPDPNTINLSLDQIIQRHLHKGTGNYIVESAKRYMEQNYSISSLSLKTVAETIYVSGEYLSRLFKKHNDTNFSDYLLKLRMEHAQQMLCSTNMPTVEIATAV